MKRPTLRARGGSRMSYLVGMGVGSGVRNTLSRVMRRLRPETGSAYIVVSDEPLDGDVLDGVKLPITILRGKKPMVVRPNRIYVAPPKHRVVLEEQKVRLLDRSDNGPIDTLFQSIAASTDFMPAGVLLGDTAPDGAAGLRAIRLAGGTTVVQDFGSLLRRSGIHPDDVDFFSSAESLVQQIGAMPWNFDSDRSALNRIVDSLRQATELDASKVDEESLVRSLGRRMTHFGIGSLSAYARHLADAPDEARLLAESIVRCAGFGCDWEVLHALQSKVFPNLAHHRLLTESIRIWVPECSKGEDAYAAAIAWLEFADSIHASIPVKIIAGESNETSLFLAKQGLYPRTLARQISPKRLARFFVKTPTGYEVTGELRGLVTFNRHHVLHSAPPHDIDLVIGRSLLAGLSPSCQARALTNFRLALRPSGFLQVSAGERNSAMSDHFFALGAGLGLYRKSREPSPSVSPSPESADIIRQADHLLRNLSKPNALVLNHQMTIVDLRGEAAALLGILPNQLQLRDASCWPALSSLVFRALQTGRAAEVERLEIASDRVVRAKAIPIHSTGCLVLVSSLDRRRQRSGPPKERLQSDLEVSAVELKAAHLEIDRLARETEDRRTALARTDTFLSNLLRTISLPFIVLAPDLTLRFATPEARKIVNMLPSDIGRPIADLAVNLPISELMEKIQRVATQVQTEESSYEIKDRDGRWQLFRIIPCFVDGRKEGVALLLVDIDSLKQNRLQLEDAKNFSEAIVQTVRHPLLVLDGELRVKKVNWAFFDTFQVSPFETNGRLVYELGSGQWNIPRLRTLLETILPSNTSFDDFEVEHEFPRIGRRTMILSARRVRSETAQTPLILLGIEDVTERRQREREQQLLAEERAARTAAEESIRLRDEFMSIASHELRTPLTSMQLSLQALIQAQKREGPARYTPDQILKMIERCERQGTRLSKLIDNLLDVSRIASRKLKLELEETDFATIVRAVLDRFKGDFEKQGYAVHSELDSPAIGHWDPIRIDQIVTNYVSNAIKYGEGKPIRIRLEQEERSVTFSITDRGIGMEPEKLKQLFEPFERLVSVRNYGGMGLGLFIVRQIVEAHGGGVQVKSRVGEGSTFSMTIPKRPAVQETPAAESSKSAGR